MYDVQEISQRIKNECKRRNLTVKKLLVDSGLSNSTVSNMSDGKMPRVDSVAKIADYLDCSIDYLLGRERQSFSVSNAGGINNSVVGHTNDHVIIQSGMEGQLSAQAQDLLRIYNNANGKTQHKIMDFVYGLEEEDK